MGWNDHPDETFDAFMEGTLTWGDVLGEDVKCRSCGCVYLADEPWCPICGDDQEEDDV